jgi:hypothetical protein
MLYPIIDLTSDYMVIDTVNKKRKLEKITDSETVIDLSNDDMVADKVNKKRKLDTPNVSESVIDDAKKNSKILRNIFNVFLYCFII